MVSDYTSVVLNIIIIFKSDSGSIGLKAFSVLFRVEPNNTNIFRLPEDRIFQMLRVLIMDLILMMICKRDSKQVFYIGDIHKQHFMIYGTFVTP